jgi:hypothetical protein
VGSYEYDLISATRDIDGGSGYMAVIEDAKQLIEDVDSGDVDNTLDALYEVKKCRTRQSPLSQIRVPSRTALVLVLQPDRKLYLGLDECSCMLVRAGSRLFRGVFTAVFAPSQFVKLEQSGFAASRIDLSARTLRLALVWLVNLVLYAVPLTLSGIGFTATETAPGWFIAVAGAFSVSPDATWQLTVGTVQNSAFLTAATAVVFVTFHTSVRLVERSRGSFQSLYTIVYTTSVYLVGMFTVVMYISTTDRAVAAEDVLIDVQLQFIETTLTLLGLGLTAGTPDSSGEALTALTPTGEFLIGVLLVLSLYFLYSMYLGARLNHGLTRLQSALVVGGVLAAPVIYVVGSAIFSLAVETAGTGVEATAWGWVR